MKLIEYSKGVDFDWDLSDKTDTETQTRRGTTDPHVGPADAIVQVFVGKKKHVKLLIDIPLQSAIGMSVFSPDGPADCLPQLEGGALQQLWRRKSTGGAEKVLGKSDSLGA